MKLIHIEETDQIHKIKEYHKEERLKRGKLSNEPSSPKQT